MVEITSNIWGTKFKIHGLDASLPPLLGQVGNFLWFFKDGDDTLDDNDDYDDGTGDRTNDGTDDDDNDDDCLDASLPPLLGLVGWTALTLIEHLFISSFLSSYIIYHVQLQGPPYKFDSN